MFRYDDVRALFGADEHDRIRRSRILVVGSGGIGCELLKTLAMVGFEDIECVDLDTIDVSNLNRQFLFRKSDVGESKAAVSARSVVEFNPSVKIIPHHANIFTFSVDRFSAFDLVINGLDNVAARRHVNRMCLLGKVPMLDGGSLGFDGQTLIVHKEPFETRCYECRPTNPPKSYPACTIRQNPSQMVHCVVWSKHLYERLFGIETSDNEFLKDVERPVGMDISDDVANEFARRLFGLLFFQDIVALIELKKDDPTVWHQDVPVPIDLDSVGVSDDRMDVDGDTTTKLDELSVWSVPQLAERFLHLGSALVRRQRIEFDKDNRDAMGFVSVVANLRATIFHIPTQSLFDVKAIAGNIIPAIATSNAIVSGLLVMEAMKVLLGHGEGERCSILRNQTTPLRFRRRQCLIMPMKPDPPKRDCYVCSSSEVVVRVFVEHLKLKTFAQGVLKDTLGMPEPMVSFSGSILWDEEDEDLETTGDRTLASFGMTSHSELAVEDMGLDELHWKVVIIDCEESYKPASEEEEVVDKETFFQVVSKKAIEESHSTPIQDDESDDDLQILDPEDIADPEEIQFVGSVPAPPAGSDDDGDAKMVDVVLGDSRKRSRTSMESSDLVEGDPEPSSKRRKLSPTRGPSETSEE